MSVVTVTSLTDATINGGGVFDVLMRTVKAHLEQEYTQNRIRGVEYSTVYLGSLEATMRMAMDFLLQHQKVDLEVQLLQKQIDIAIATECKLRAEYDLIMLQKDRTVAETNLLAQKLQTEKAQTLSLGIDEDSVLGRQKALYKAQTDGFSRDAEQKAAKIMVDSWNVRRTTDEGTVADGTNMLSDVIVGRAVTKLLAGVGA